jgi:hypothetical protein
MTSYIFPVMALAVANVVFWFKGNAKELYGLDWSPFKWWLYTSLLTNYLTLHAWWKLIEISNVWKAGVTWGLVSLVTDLLLNTLFYGLNLRGIVALLLCGLASLIAHKS